jgi:pimeloyl-ACP methyl ester carboxylesterase
MPKVTSKDGTTIAYDQSGQGPAVILVDGAFCHRNFGPMGALSPLLEPQFTVLKYDRRGRGESGDTLPYAIEREIEDISAVIEAAGGSAAVYGISSGAALALEAVISGLNINKLALYEPPYNDDTKSEWAAYRSQLSDLLAQDRRGDAVALFMRYVGTPDDAIAGMRQAPMWPAFEAIAHTLAYDAAILGDGSVPTRRAAAVTIPTRVMAGGDGFPFMQENAVKLEKAIPNSQRRILEGQTHEVAADVMAPALIEFFAG